MNCVASADYGREGTGGAALDGLSELYEIEAIEDGLEHKQGLGKLLVVEMCLHPFPLEHSLTFYEEKIT
jgi:hypothetical protein